MKKTILLIVFTLFTYGCESKKSSVDKSNIAEPTPITGTYVDSRDGELIDFILRNREK